MTHKDNCDSNIWMQKKTKNPNNKSVGGKTSRHNNEIPDVYSSESQL